MNVFLRMAAVGAVALTLAAGQIAAAETSDQAKSRAARSPAGAALSGASAGNAAKQFASWRGSDLEIAGTWADSGNINEPRWSVGTGSQWSWWSGPTDIAVGGPRGTSWARAADGALDGFWRQQLTVLESAWGSRDQADLYIRFAHEFNGTWFPWSVSAADLQNYKRAYIRFTSIQREVLPKSKAVWAVNAGTNQAYDIRDAYPGERYVDVIGVDWYNSWPWVNTATDFDYKINMRQSTGGPVGIETWRQYAASVGKPVALPEWANDAVGSGISGERSEGGGDAPMFFLELNRWLEKHGGSGPGQVLYEVYFNVESGYPSSEFWLVGASGRVNPRATKAAEVYRELW